MKKIVMLIISVFFFTSISNAEIAPEDTSWDWNSYIYYYWQGCTHCAKLDNFLDKTDAYNRLNIEKKEVYFDNTNRSEMLQACTRMWINESDSWVPFVLVTTGSWEELALFWDTDIINYVSPYLWWEVEDINNDSNSNKTIILVVIWLLAIIIPVVIINITNKK